jgi:siroheme synthase-like protein
MTDDVTAPGQTTYPIMLNLEAVPCLIVGGGEVATRKLMALLETGAVLHVLSPNVSESIQAQVDATRVAWDARSYSPGIITAIGPRLVFAATDSPETNRQIADEAREIGAWVNIASQPETSSFSNMAVIRRSPITIGLHTGGMSPALTRHLRAKINDVIGEEYVTLSAWLGDMRSTIRNSISPQARRQAVYENILDSDVLGLLKSGQTQAAQQRLRDIVDGWVQP